MTVSGALDHRDALLEQVRALLGPISELQNPAPSSAVLGELAFAAHWDAGRRERFAKGLVEALEASIDADDPTPIEAYVRLMSHANEPVAPQLRASFLDELGDEVRARTRR